MVSLWHMLNISASDGAYQFLDWANTLLSVTENGQHLFAMLCNKVCFPSVLQAQAVALTVAQAFTVAFELWQVAKEGRNCTTHPPRSWNDTETQALSAELFYQHLRLLMFGQNQPWCSKDIDMSCAVAVNKVWPACVLISILEKGKRAKSGSAGEGSSSSNSERSNSLGSLKGTGEQNTSTKNKIL